MTSQIQPIFVIGAPRSGTSIMTWAIGQHPNIQPMPETAWLAVHTLGSYNAWLKGSERGALSHLSNVEFTLESFMERVGESANLIVKDVFEKRCQKFYGDYRKEQKLVLRGKEADKLKFHLLRNIDDPKARWIDGTPANTFYLWGLSKMFPDARFIHNLRTPYEVVRSLAEFEKAGGTNRDLETAFREWYHHTLCAYHFQLAMGKDKVFVADFTRLADDPELLLKDLYEFLGEADCTDSQEVFSKKINSSKITQTERNKKITNHSEYKKSVKLYENALNWEKPEMRAEYLEKVKTQFVNQAKQNMPF